MPLLKVRHISEHAHLALWEVTEKIPDLLKLCLDKKELQQELDPITSEKIRLEKAATRVCLHVLLQSVGLSYKGIYRDVYRKPHLNKLEGYISFTHSYPYVGVIYDARENTGIDIQDIQPKILKIAPRFLSDHESTFVSDDPVMATIIWCAKETIYKIHGRKSLHFRHNIEIESIPDAEGGEIIALLKENTEITSYNLEHARINDYIVVHKK